MSEMPWVKSYPNGVRWDAPIKPEPVQKLLEDAAANWPDKPALQFMGKRISYRELDALAVGDLHGEQRMRKGVWLIERECIRAYLRNELCEHRRSNVRDITAARGRRGA